MNSTAHVDEEVHGKVLEVDLHGRLSRSDYEWFAPETERLIRQYGRIRILVTMHDFEGWNAKAVWEDIKWNVSHFRHIERLAVVGGKSDDQDVSGAFDVRLRHGVRWHKWLTNFCRQFANAQVRYFTLDQLDEARAWINEFHILETLPPIFPPIP